MASSLEPRVVFLMAGGGLAARPWARRVMGRPIDWERVADTAAVEGAAGELLRAVSDERLPVPEPALARLRPVAMVTDFRQHLLGTRLVDALAVLGAARVDVVLLKGSALVASVYGGSFERRPMSDIDLLVDPGSAERARDALLAAGWRWDREAYAEHHYARHHHLPPLMDGTGSGIAIELHTEILPTGNPFAFASAGVRARSVTATLGGRVVRVPSPHDQLLHTLVHYAWSHAMAPGAWRTVRDVAALCATHQIEWNAFTRLAQDARCATACYWSLRLARDLAEVPVPDDTLARLAPSLPAAILDRLARHFTQIALRHRSACPSVTLRRALWTFALQPRRSGHGAARPWTSGFEFEHGPAAAPPGWQERTFARLGRWRQWSRYVASMLGPSPDGSFTSSSLLK